MKSLSRLLSYSALCIPALCLPLQAHAEKEPQFTTEKWLAGFAEYYHADGDKFDQGDSLKDGLSYGAEVGMRFKPHWGARLEWSRMQLDHATGLSEIKGHKLGIDLLYYPTQSDFYLFTGFKNQVLDQSYRTANLGLGYHYKLSDKWRMVTELAGYYDFGQGFEDYSAKFGFAYTFGQPAPRLPIAPPAPKDSDNDGVIDSQDQCPNTLNNIKVDQWGCRLFVDQDSDGVADHLDRCANTAINAKVDTEGCPLTAHKTLEQSLRVQFAHNSSQISTVEQSSIDRFAQFMQQYPQATTVITGHTSALGDADYNLWLSKQRAEAVKQMLVEQHQIEAERITATGKGEQDLLDTANTLDAHRKNRRITAYTQVEITYTPSKEEK